MPLVSMKFTGLDGLDQALRELGSSKAVRKAQNKALMLAAEPAAKMARSLAPRKTGEMAETIDVSTTLSQRQRHGRSLGPNEAYVYVGPKPRGPGVLEEFGTTQRSTKTGKSTGAAPAHPFMRPAWDANKARIPIDFARFLWVVIQAEAARLAKKAGKP